MASVSLTTPAAATPQAVAVESITSSRIEPAVQAAPVQQPAPASQGMSMDNLYSFSSKGGINAQRSDSSNKEKSSILPYWFLRK
jgi:hypothetical protein